jgi:predicted permease
MIAAIFILLLPLFLTIAVGYLYAKRFPVSDDTLFRVLADIVAPMMFFYSLYTSPVSGELVLRIGGAAGFVVVSLTILGLLWTGARKLDPRGYLLAIIIYNTGFLGMPLMKLWGGVEAMNIILIYDQLQGVFAIGIGIMIVTGGFSAGRLLEVLKTPLFFSIILGMGFRFLKVPVPDAVLKTCEFAGSGMGSLAALALGCSLTKRRLRFDSHLAMGYFLRTGAGFLLGAAAVFIFDIQGMARTVFIVGSALPSALFSYVLTSRYGADPDFTGTMILASTTLGVVSIPLAFWGASFF